MTFRKSKVLCFICALALLTVMVAGCSAPKLTLGGTKKVAATVGDTTVSTGEYLAYLYSNFATMFYSQGLYQYAQYGYDVWEQEMDYGEGDDAQTLKLAEYLKAMTKDTIVRNVALEQLMAKYGISWDADDEAEVDESLKELEDGAYLDLGFSNDNFVKVYKKMNLNESGLFYGLYGEGGERAVSEADRKAYFDENYVSYKIISHPMTDSEGAELDEDGQKEVLDELNGYLEQYNKDKNFEAVVDAHNVAEGGDESATSTDEDNRINVDSSSELQDEELMKAVKGIDVGKAAVVTYKADGTTLTGALILRLDIHNPETLFADSSDDIIYSMKFDEFDEEVKEAMKGLQADFNKSVIKACDPKKFAE